MPLAPIPRGAVRRALKAYHLELALGRSPLADMAFVTRRLAELGVADTASRRGAIVRGAIDEAIALLRPRAADGEAGDKRSRAHRLLTRHYIDGAGRDEVAQGLAISLSTFDHDLHDALDFIAQQLDGLEERAQESAAPTDASPKAAHGSWPVFIAPPPPQTRMLGRAPVLDQLRALVTPGAVVAISGLPGIGKSTLALMLAHDAGLGARFRDGVVWLGAGANPDLDAILMRWVRTFDLDPGMIARQPTPFAKARAISDGIADRALLFVIDDVWSVETALALRLGGARCAHVFTTRVPAVASALAGAGAAQLTELDPSVGLAVLKTLAASLDASHDAELAEVARLTGGLPLSLTILGGYLGRALRTSLPRRVEQALEAVRDAARRAEIARPLSAGEAQWMGLSAPQLSLSSAVELSEAVLSPDARAGFAALSALAPKPASFDEAAALAVTARGEAALDELVDVGLLETAGGRYQLHQALHDVATLRRGADEAPVQRVIAHYAAWVEAHGRDAAAMGPELDGVIDAARQARLRGQDAELLRLVTGARGHLLMEGLYPTAQELLESALDAARRAGDRAAEALTLARLAYIARMLGAHARALELLGAAQPIAYDLEDSALVCDLLIHTGGVYSDSGRYAQALETFSACAQLAEEDQLPAYRAYAQANVGNTAVLLARYGEAERAFDQSLAIAGGMSDARLLAHDLNGLGWAQLLSGRFAEAVATLQRADEALKDAHAPASLVYVLANLITAYLELGELAQAGACAERAMALAAGSSDPHLRASALSHKAEYCMRAGQDAQAGPLFREALALAQQVGDAHGQCRILCGLAGLHIARRAWREAAACADDLVRIATQAQLPGYQAEGWFAQAQVQAGNGGEIPAARALAARSAELFGAIGHYRAAAVRAWLTELG